MSSGTLFYLSPPPGTQPFSLTFSYRKVCQDFRYFFNTGFFGVTMLPHSPEGRGGRMPPPSSHFLTSGWTPWLRVCHRGAPLETEVAPMQKSLYLSLFLVFSKRGSMRKGHPLSSEAIGHPGPLGSRRWRRPGRTQG